MDDQLFGNYYVVSVMSGLLRSDIKCLRKRQSGAIVRGRYTAIAGRSVRDTLLKSLNANNCVENGLQPVSHSGD